MNRLDIIDIHEKFKDVYDDYNLIGSYKLYLPYYKIDLGVNYLTETKLNVLEEYICRCISLGVVYKEDICYSMGIKEDIFEYCTNELIKEKYLENTENRYFFTDEGRLLFEKLHRKQTLKSIFEFYLNGINNEYCTLNEVEGDTDQQVDNKRFIGADKISNEKDCIILSPRKLPVYKSEDFEYVSNIITKSYLDKEDRVIDIRLLDQKEIKYSCYTLLVYYNDSKYKILACDYNSRVDKSVTQVLQELYEQNKLIEFIEENDHHNNYSKLNSILENYETEINIHNIEDGVEGIKELIEDIKESVKEDNSLAYIMNYEIREKFKYYLKNAQESLYIISPWMNNYIINREFTESLESLLKKGVKVRIIYGISSKDEIKDDYRNKNTDQIANKLKEIGKSYGDLFKIKHGQTHEKLLICDRKYYINGSFNFLSYSGETTGKFRNEGSTYSENQNLINQTIKLRFNE